MPKTPRLSRKKTAGEVVALPKTLGRANPTNNLPLQLSSLIGRDRERAEAGKLLADRRLLTLTGPGGSGKTRLAVAGVVAEKFENGVWWYYLALAEEAEPELKGARQAEWLGRLEMERGNLRAALAWSIESGDAEPGLRLAGALERFWWTRGHLSEGRRWLDRGLDGTGASPASARAKALNEAGWMALWQDDLERAVKLLEESLGSFKDLGDEPGVATSLTNLGHAVLHHDDKERLAALCEEAGALREKFVDRWAVAELLVFLGMAALYGGDHALAETLLEESVALFRDLGDTQRVTICLTYLWMAALEGGDHTRAVKAIKHWKMYETGWTRLCWPDAPISEGAVVGVVGHHLGIRSLNACRIAYVFEDKGPSLKRYGFAVGTLPGHVEQGEERFTVEWNVSDDSVSYEIFAFSRPSHPLVRATQPLARRLQSQFALDSLQSMAAAVTHPQTKS